MQPSQRRNIVVWQLLFVLLSTTWLWAPHLNHLISYRTTLVSQYEAYIQPFSWLFRLGDLAGASLLIVMALVFIKVYNKKVAGYLLLTIGIGSFIDPLVPTTCHPKLGVCQEYISLPFIVHAIETVITALAFFALGAYDSWLRKRLVSIAFVGFQIAYLVLFITQLAAQDDFNTISQYLYQAVLIVWIAWFCRDFLIGGHTLKPSQKEMRTVTYLVAAWAFINGMLAIAVSLAHLRLLGKVWGLYFSGDNAWLAQHGVVIGVIMLYLSRQLARGELRARQLFLILVGFETLKYSVITPDPALMLLYLTTFCTLFVLRDDFGRGLVAMTLKFRIKDVVYMLGALTVAGLLALGLLYRAHELKEITRASIDDFFDYIFLHSHILSRAQTKSALLAHTITAFILISIGMILWILFRPYRNTLVPEQGHDKAEALLTAYSRSSEDYFKLWPMDKQYFFSDSVPGFIAYKVVGPIAFALADPITDAAHKDKLLAEFVAWSRSQRLSACFLPAYSDGTEMYKRTGLNVLHIGASALIDTNDFLQNTVNNKWWRWQKNRATRGNYRYATSAPPHSPTLMQTLGEVSDEWLKIDGHAERGFALGYFDEDYLQKCRIHYLTDEHGNLLAFTNELPEFRRQTAATVDLLRYLPDSNNAMPFLLYKTIEHVTRDGRSHFDLGFVPFVSAQGPLLAIARTISAGRFSAKGLEQFKNKFNPTWEPNYMAYDGDLADLALIVVNLERAMMLRHSDAG